MESPHPKTNLGWNLLYLVKWSKDIFGIWKIFGITKEISEVYEEIPKLIWFLYWF